MDTRSCGLILSPGSAVEVKTSFKKPSELIPAVCPSSAPAAPQTPSSCFLMFHPKAGASTPHFWVWDRTTSQYKGAEQAEERGMFILCAFV